MTEVLSSASVYRTQNNIAESAGKIQTLYASARETFILIIQKRACQTSVSHFNSLFRVELFELFEKLSRNSIIFYETVEFLFIYNLRRNDFQDTFRLLPWSVISMFH